MCRFSSNYIEVMDSTSASLFSSEVTEDIRESVEKMLADEHHQDGRLIGGLKDLSPDRSLKFSDHARGLRWVIGVPKSW